MVFGSRPRSQALEISHMITIGIMILKPHHQANIFLKKQDQTEKEMENKTKIKTKETKETEINSRKRKKTKPSLAHGQVFQALKVSSHDEHMNMILEPYHQANISFKTKMKNRKEKGKK